MAVHAPLLVLLEQADRAFALCGKLGQEFMREHGTGGYQVVDLSSWTRHEGDFDALLLILSGLGEAITAPPEGFGCVARVLYRLGQVAKSIRDTRSTSEGRQYAVHLKLFPELNAAARDGARAVDEARRSCGPADPLGFLAAGRELHCGTGEDRGTPAAAGRRKVPFAPNAVQSPQPGGSKLPSQPKATRAKRSTQKGDGQDKLRSALVRHHEYENGSARNHEPVGSNELARLADVDKSTASAFFMKQFKGYANYRAMCGDSANLVASLKMLNGEFSPHVLLRDGGASIDADAD